MAPLAEIELPNLLRPGCGLVGGLHGTVRHQAQDTESDGGQHIAEIAIPVRVRSMRAGSRLYIERYRADVYYYYSGRL